MQKKVHTKHGHPAEEAAPGSSEIPELVGSIIEATGAQPKRAQILARARLQAAKAREVPAARRVCPRCLDPACSWGS